MAKNFASLAFTDSIKALQEKNGSRSSYARLEREKYTDGLTKFETDFIHQRDSFYMASIGENNFPYIQHRGGPKGFLKVLDAKRIGFIDFRGNMQYISVGNMAGNNNVALIMVDYPSKTRLKILAKAEVVELKDDPALYNLLDLTAYKFMPERMIVLHIEAYDWNCPQHISPRYTIEEIEQAFSAQRDHIASLEAEVKKLKHQLKER
jgi:predicted pyridoxine 5'-phosphate oxidase superfamily flavin-nucleotide-binding protein